MKLHDLREMRALKVAEMRGLLDSAQGKLNAEQQKQFDALKNEVTSIEAQEARASFLEEQERRMVTGNTAESRDRDGMEGRVSILRVLQAQTEGRSLSGAEAEYAKETERRTGRKAEGIFVPLSAFETRVNTTTSAGELVPTDHRADQYISPLRNALLARRLGVRVLSGLRGNVTVPKHGTGLSVGWVAEGGNVPDADMAFDPVTLAPKHAGGKTEMSRQLIQQSSPDVEQLIRDDLAFAIAKAIDHALIVGGGTNEPVGVLNTAGIQQLDLAGHNWVNFLGMLSAAMSENATPSAWLTNPDAMPALASTLKFDVTNEAAANSFILENGRIDGLPCYFTNQVPKKNNATAPLVTNQMILGDWSQVLLGIWSEIDLLVNPYAEPAYSRGGVNVRVMTTCDVAVRHPKAFVVDSTLPASV